MFIAWRGLKFAKGRFALLGGVIALMTFMVVLLSGLTAGLGAASVSAVSKLPVDAIAFSRPTDGQNVSFTNSSLSIEAADRLGSRTGVQDAYPFGLSSAQVHGPEATVAVSLLGGDPALYPARESGTELAPGQIAVTADLAADAGLTVGDVVPVAGAGLLVAAVVADTTFNHMPLVYTDVATWQRLAHADTVTAVGLRLDGVAPASLDTDTVQAVSKKDAFAAVGAYTSEQGSLNLMRGLLIVVSVLVVGSFFTVWTMQRAGDLAVVRAIGASRRYLLGDALGQAVVVLLAGTAIGAGTALAAGLLAAKVVPFELALATVLVPLAAMAGTGLVGAALSVRRIGSVDPLTALGAAR